MWHFGAYNHVGDGWVWKHPDNYRSAVAEQIGVLRQLLASRPVASRMPDLDPLDPSTRFDHHERICCLRDTERTYLMVCAPNGADIKIRTDHLAGSSYHAWWYNPRTGDVIDLGTSANTGAVVTFDPPGEPGANYTDTDCVLALDDAAREYSKPGNNG